ncbi:MAG: hypothetical protein GY832_26405 [Chloroflexi bacterium]|nr:hypothetical protein [Chloroflexota bacterium]
MKSRRSAISLAMLIVIITSICVKPLYALPIASTQRSHPNVSDWHTKVTPPNQDRPPLPGDGRILFYSERDDRSWYTVNADGSGLMTIEDVNCCRSGECTPDGKYKVSLCGSPGEDGIPDTLSVCITETDGSFKWINLTDHTGHDQCPELSPDGTRITFHNHDVNRKNSIYVVNIDGSGLTRLTDTNDWSGSGFCPTWSPDNTRVAYTNDRGSIANIYVVSADGSNLIKLTNADWGDPQRNQDPAWSPDGTRIAFSSTRDGDGEIYVMNADGSGAIRLTHAPGWDGSPSWSPDGTLIAFTSRRDGNEEVYVMNVDGSNQINLTNHPANDRGTWVSKDCGPVIQTPQITLPTDQTRVLQCQTDVSGTAEPGAQIHLWNINHFPGQPPQEGELPAIGFPEEIDTTTADDDGNWVISQVPLMWEDNYLHAIAEKDDTESDVSSYIHVLCRRPWVIFNDPSDTTVLVPYDQSEESAIAFRFDVPMDTTSINGQTVWLVSEFLEIVRGTVSYELLEGDEQPTYFFHPDTKLRQATEYTVYLDDDIRAAPPNESAHILSYHWMIKTTGAEREQLIQAIRDLADRACEKIDRDIETTARTFSDVYEIEESLQMADVGKVLFSLTTTVVEIFGSIPDLANDLPDLVSDIMKKKPISPETVILQLSSLALSTYGTVAAEKDHIESQDDNLWLQAGLTEEDLAFYKEVLENDDKDTNLLRSELELVLLGAGRSSPLRIPVMSNTVDGYATTGIVEGASSVKKSIRQHAENLIDMLPDPLPSGFPTEEICQDIRDVRFELMRSTTEPVHIEHSYRLYDQGSSDLSVGTRYTRLGAIAVQSHSSQQLQKALHTQNEIEANAIFYDAMSASISVAFMHPSLGFLQPLEWGLVGRDILVGLDDVARSFQADPRDLLLQVPIAMLNELPIEISNTDLMTSDIFDTIWDKTKLEATDQSALDVFTSLWLASPAYAAEPESFGLDVTDMNLGDVTVTSGKPIGLGHGQCTVINNSDSPQQIRARIQILPLNPLGGKRPQIGKGWSQEWVTVEPRAEVSVDIDYQVLPPGLTGQVDIQALVTLQAIPVDGSWPWTAGPFSQIIRVGTQEHLENMPPLDTQTVLAGELAIGEIHTTTLSLPSDPQSTMLLLSHATGISLALSLQDDVGNQIAFDGMGRPAHFQGLTGTHSSGPGYQVVTLDEPPTGPLLLSVQGIVSKRGNGLRYEVKLLPTTNRSVSMDLFTPTPEPEQVAETPAVEQASEEASNESQAGLPWTTIIVASLVILVIIGAIMVIGRRR